VDCVNYYEHHLGDWAAATGHLSWDEDMAYTRLLRAYYHHERAIPDGQQYRLAKASTPAQRKAVDQVLTEFFELREGQYRQKRADAEIARYQDKQRKAKASAEARWSQSGRNANASPDAMRTHSEGNALQTPDTRHQSKEKTEQPARKRALALAPPADVEPQVWADWLQLRKAKRAPVTQTVIDGARAEAGKAGMPLQAFLSVWCRRGSQGLEAAWLRPDERSPAQPPAEPEWRTEQRQRMTEALGPYAAKRPKAEVVDLQERPNAAFRLG
jgi:uncharacterized protein YdaU (DUF1376 family)